MVEYFLTWRFYGMYFRTRYCIWILNGRKSFENIKSKRDFNYLYESEIDINENE